MACAVSSLLLPACHTGGSIAARSGCPGVDAVTQFQRPAAETARPGRNAISLPPASPRRMIGTRDNRFMAAGDPQRVWFGQMVERLRDRWHPDMSFDALISLRDDLDSMLQRLRLEGNISSPVFRCRDCGYVGPAATPHVSVRAMVLSLARFGIAPAEQIHALENVGRHTANRMNLTCTASGRLRGRLGAPRASTPDR